MYKSLIIVGFVPQPTLPSYLIKRAHLCALYNLLRTYAVIAYLFTSQAFSMPLCSQNALVSTSLNTGFR